MLRDSVERADPVAQLAKARLVEDRICVRIGLDRHQIQKAGVGLVAFDLRDRRIEPTMGFIRIAERKVHQCPSAGADGPAGR